MRRKSEKLATLILWGTITFFAVPGAVAQTNAGRKLVFSDEFNEPLGTPVAGDRWTFEIGGKGWGNEELQFYTDDVRNASHDGAGSLAIRAVKQDRSSSAPDCWYGRCLYTSARLVTKRKFEAKYGRFEARIKIPRGQGMWAAFWLLGNNIDTAGWPRCGEIDIMENIGREPSTVHGTVHGPGYSGQDGIGAAYSLEGKRVFADDFHVFAVEWRENEIRWYVDGNLYRTLAPENLPPGKPWVYDHPFFIILNLAVGGNWGGRPDETTAFPQAMLVDYVRVYEP